jgi:hypothetical protein
MQLATRNRQTEILTLSLAKEVRDSIDKNRPESGLDRLHTFAVKCIRVLCEKHRIPTGRDTALNSLFGEYVKKLKESGLIESVKKSNTKTRRPEG